jgi:hypothetical protein
MLMGEAVAPLLGSKPRRNPLTGVHAQLRAVDHLLIDLFIGRAVLVLDDADVASRPWTMSRASALATPLNEGQSIQYEIESSRGKESAINLKVK